MSYIQIQNTHGETIECSDISALDYQANNTYNMNAFMDELERRITENKNEGKTPFDGIDLPQGSIQDNMTAVFFVKQLLSEDRTVFRAALQEEIAKDGDVEKRNGVLNFVVDSMQKLNSNQQSEARDKFGALIAGEVGRLYGETLDSMPLTTLCIYNEHAVKHNKNTAPLRPKGGNTWLSRGDSLNEIAVNSVLASMKPNSGYGLTTSDLADVYPILLKSDLSRLSDEDKNLIFTRASSCSSNKERISKAIDEMPVQNLSEENFLKRKGMSLEDAQGFFKDKDKEYMYSVLSKASDTNESVKSVLGQVAIDILKDKAHEIPKYIKEEDIIRGYKENPEALKAFGVEIPRSLCDILSKDKELSTNPDFKFVIAAHEHAGADRQGDGVIKGLAEISQEGLQAGFAPELMLQKAEKWLDMYKDVAETEYRTLKASLSKEEEIGKAKSEYDHLSQIRDMVRSIERKCDGSEFSVDDVLKKVCDKAGGKDVEPFEYTAKTHFWDKKEKKEQEQRKEELCKELNGLIAEYGEKFKDSECLSRFPTAAEIEKQCNQAYSESQQPNPYADILSRQEEILHRKETVNTIEALHKSATEKIEYQVSLKGVAHETSGVKGMEQGVGLDVMAIKEEYRKANPTASSKELYEAVEASIKEGKYAAPADKLLKLSGRGKAQSPKKIKSTGMPKEATRSGVTSDRGR